MEIMNAKHISIYLARGLNLSIIYPVLLKND